jgi:branched-chain amino acid aminotransferase
MKVSSWRRMDPNVNPVAAKGTGIYINSSLAKVEAVQSGYDEAILLNTHGQVAECTGENIFIVKDGTLITPPLSSGALGGFTRDSIMTIARDLGVPVEETILLRHDLYLADEAFLTGTAAEVVPISSVDGREIGPRGEITKLLQTTYLDAVRGKVERYKDWLEYVN